MEEALHAVPPYREIAKLEGVTARLPDETTMLRSRARALLPRPTTGPETRVWAPTASR